MPLDMECYILMGRMVKNIVLTEKDLAFIGRSPIMFEEVVNRKLKTCYFDLFKLWESDQNRKGLGFDKTSI